MNKDDFDLYQHLSRSSKNNGAAEFIRGLQVRESGNFRRKVNTKEEIQQYAEDQFIRKGHFSEMRCEMPGAPRSTFLMVFSPDGRRAASTHGNHNIYVTDLRSGKNIKTLVGHPRTPWCIAFHPTSDQIVASGCLGGQVRIWDLSGSSEVWTTSSNSVIASIAFHPNDRVLVIATFNEVYFWDWSQPKPFVHVATSNPKEKVRYVAFDKLGHKLITGIANSPQTRWERVRAPVPVPRQERCASPYRRRITQRLVVNPSTAHEQQSTSSQELPPEGRTAQSHVPERERRIALCYRNLVREYENLVQRYIQLYLPPTMIDRGTDPMEPSHYNSGTQTAGPSNVDAPTPSCSRDSNDSPAVVSSATTPSEEDPQPSTSQQSQNLITPSRMFVVGPKPPSFIKGTQTTESRKHKTDGDAAGNNCEKRFKRSHDNRDSSDSDSSDSDCPADPSRSSAVASSEIPQNSRVLVVNLNRLNADRLESSSSANNSQAQSTSPSERPTSSASRTTARDDLPGLNLPSIFHYDNVRPPEQSDAAGRSSRSNHRERFEQYVRANRERILEFQRRNASVRNRVSQEDTEREDIMLSSSSRYDHLYGGTTPADREIEINLGSTQQVPQNNSEELLTSMRRNAVQEVRNRMLPILRSVPPNDRAELIRLFGNSRESSTRPRNRQGHLRRHNRRTLIIDSSTDTSSSDTEPDQATRSGSSDLVGHQFAPTPLDLSVNRGSSPPDRPASPAGSPTAPTVGTAPTNPVGERNFNTELEQLVTSLLIEIERTESGQNRTASVNTNSDSARTRPCRPRSPFPPLRQPPGESIENLIQHRARPARSDFGPTRRHENGLSSRAASCRSLFPSQEPRGAHLSPYQPYSRLRFFSRVSAFMPTRVSYTRARLRRSPNRYPYGSGRSGIHRSPFRAASVMLDELVNYGARENSEGEPPQAPRSSSPSPFNSQNVDNIRSMYSYIIQDLELSLNDVHHLRSSSRPGETSDMLSNFSQRLETILTQSEAILTTLRRSGERQPNSGGSENGSTGTPENDLRWNYNDPGFYVRDLRIEGSSGVTTSRAALQNLIGSLGAVASDHTYPRNPNSPSTSDNMNSVNLAISHIQEQTRMLRRQVDSVERVDRALVEVSQLTLIRQLIVGMVGHVRLRSGEGGHAGVSSVRQMMAGTRISDSSPYDSPNEEANASRPAQRWANTRDSQSEASPGTSNVNDQPGPSSGSPPVNQRRCNSRKTYPPSKYSRRHQTRPLLLHWFHRRFPNQTLMHNRNPVSRPTSQPQSLNTAHNLFNYSNINPSTLGLMTRRLERLLTEQMRVFNRSTNIPQESRSSTSVDLGEHILALRLHGCLLRINRVLGQRIDSSGVRNLREPAASPEGAGRYAARHTLSLIVDGMSRYIEELGSTNMEPRTRLQVLSVLAMSLLLTDLLLLQVVESIPSPTDVNLDPESEALVRRIDDMCLRILQNRFMGIPGLLSRSLRLMRLTLRRAHRVLDSTYLNLRNAMTARQEPDRARLIGNINRCLRALNRQPAGSGGGYFRGNNNPNMPSTSSGTGAVDDMFDDDFYQVIDDLISYYTENREDERLESTDDRRPLVDNVEDDLLSSNDNSDDEPEGPHGTWGYYSSRHLLRHNNSLYRTNNVNLVLPSSRPEPSSPASPSGCVPWNVPMVQVNDEPVLEQPFTAHRPMPRSVYADRHRETYAERLSELRTHSRMGLFRPRFLHPLYASVNPFDADLDDSREHIYDSDMITTVTPNHRIQAWDFSHGFVPPISNPIKNVVVNECKIHNDASVDISSDGTILVTLLPSGGYLNVTNRLGVYSLRWETLGQCLYTTSFEQNAVSVSLSPLSRHLVVGFVSRRVSIAPSDRWIMARIYRIEQKDVPGDRLPILKELEQHRENRINCIRWLPMSGQGLIYATNTGQLVVLS